jgi:prepilin-type N-terminal cleavage/methylation domain-containing protein
MDDMNTKRSNSGFTLIEVLTIMLVVAVLASVGLPGMTRMLEGNRLSANTNRLVSSLYAARSEAVKRNTDVVICTRNNAGDGCDAGEYWNNGWIVFVDDDKHGDPGYGVYNDDDADEVLLNLVEKSDTGMVFKAGASKNIRFTGEGMVDANADGKEGEILNDKVSFKLESDHDRRMICLGSSGSIRAYDAAACP